MSNPLDNIKPFLAVAGTLIAVGIGWAQLNQRIGEKAEREDLRQVEQALDRHIRDDSVDRRINRILLCRHPEIRPDSYCEGYR